MKKVNEKAEQPTQPKSKLEELMTKNGKPLKPKKEPKDSTKLSAKELADLSKQMLKDFGYIL